MSKGKTKMTVKGEVQIFPSKQSALVIGVGSRSGIGGAVAYRFSIEGLHVYVVGRTEEKLAEVIYDIQANGGTATAIVNELKDMDNVAALFTQVKSAGKPLAAVVYNAAFKNLPQKFMQIKPEYVEANWRLTCLAGIMVGQAAVRYMLPQGYGTVIFTGATASLRGKPLFAAFASAKAALRSFTLTLANESAPQGIHVAHIVIDGIVAGDRAKTTALGLGRLAILSKGEQGALLPDEIATTYWQLHAQQRGAWTHELELRPFKEKF